MKKTFLIIITILGFSLMGQVNNVHAGEYTPGSACGFTQPNVQFWGNCNVNPYNGCKSDPTQKTQWGWYSGSNINDQDYVTSPSDPLWMQVQCFVQLSFGPGCATPTYVEVKNVDTGEVIATQNKTNCSSKVFQVPNPGKYRATCYYSNTNPTCVASYDEFRVKPRVVPCTPTAPGLATLSTPANNSSIQYNQYGTTINFGFDVNAGGWGTGCPNNTNSWNLQIQRDCTGNWASFGSVYTVPSNYFTTPGQPVCWRVIKSNGSLSSISNTYRFTLVEDRSWLTTNNGLAADVCGGGFSGVSTSAGTSNPITYDVEFETSTIAGNTYKELWFAMVPDYTSYNTRCPAYGGSVITNSVCQNMESTDIQSESVILQKAKNANTFVYKMIFTGSGAGTTLSEIRAYNGTGWNSVSTTGADLTSLGATFLGFKNTSTGSLVGTGILRGKFVIRFDNVPLGKYAFYGSTVMTNTIGELRVSYAQPGNPSVFKRLPTTKPSLPLGGITNWGVDLVPPSATSAFTSTKYLPNGQFQINWNFNEANSLQLKSFISRDNTDSTLTDTTSGLINFGINPPDAAKFNNNTLKFSDILSWNGNVNEGNLGIRTYQDSDTSKQTNYQFYGYARDAACNQKVITTTATLQKPWTLSYNGDLSAGGGIVGMTLPSALTQLSDDLKDRTGKVIFNDKQAAFLSSYSAISGTTEIPLRKVSRYNQFITGYEDLTLKPPLDSGYSQWYEYLYNTVSKNKSASILTVTGSAVLSGQSSSMTGSVGSKAHILVEGNLTVEKGAKCDTQTIFFVKGNLSAPIDSTYPGATIKINPDFTNVDNNSACMFVTSGDIIIDNGDSATSGLSVDLSQLANYDVIEAALITDGQFITKLDIPGANLKGDGLALKGSVVSNNVILQRDVNLTANQFQPSQLFVFDPRFREIFKADLNYVKYSIRETGY